MRVDMSTGGEPPRESDNREGKPGRISLRVAMLLAVLGCILGLVLASQLQLAPQEAPTYQYFHETRHSVSDPFYAYYREHGGERIFGLPITEVHIDDAGRQVQYFQRARMELRDNGQVGLANLAEEMGYGKPAPPPELLPPDGPHSRRFASGHSSAYAFLSFYDQNGGDAVFGDPITEPELINGRISQTWQRARMEWWPDNPAGQRVVLLNIGSVYASRYVPGAWLAPVAAGVSTGTGLPPTPVPTELYVMAMRAIMTLSPGDVQTVQVMVQDQTGRAVKGANIRMVEVSRAGQWELPAAATDATGLLAVSYVPSERTPGEVVVVEVTVTFGGLTRVVQTSYLVY